MSQHQIIHKANVQFLNSLLEKFYIDSKLEQFPFGNQFVLVRLNFIDILRRE